MTASFTKTRAPAILAVNVVFGALTILIVLLRTYTRALIVKSFGLDDWITILSTIFYVVYTFCSTFGASFGIGQHMASLAPSDIRNAMMYWWFCYLFYILTMICSKLSFAWFLLRITTAKTHSWIIYTASATTVLAGIAFFFVALCQCRPVSYYWDKRQSGQCFEMDAVMLVAYLYSAISVITDLTFAVLPGFVIWNLNMAKKTKVALIVLIAMGCVACSAIIVRMAYLWTLRDPDFLWTTTDLVIWTSIEMGLAISAASLATLRPLVRKVAWRLGAASSPHSATHLFQKDEVPPSKSTSNRRGDPLPNKTLYSLSTFSRDSTASKPIAKAKVATRSAAYRVEQGERFYALTVKADKYGISVLIDL